MLFSAPANPLVWQISVNFNFGRTFAAHYFLPFACPNAFVSSWVVCVEEQPKAEQQGRNQCVYVVNPRPTQGRTGAYLANKGWDWILDGSGWTHKGGHRSGEGDGD